MRLFSSASDAISRSRRKRQSRSLDERKRYPSASLECVPVDNKLPASCSTALASAPIPTASPGRRATRPAPSMCTSPTSFRFFSKSIAAGSPPSGRRSRPPLRRSKPPVARRAFACAGRAVASSRVAHVPQKPARAHHDGRAGAPGPRQGARAPDRANLGASREARRPPDPGAHLRELVVFEILCNAAADGDTAILGERDIRARLAADVDAAAARGRAPAPASGPRRITRQPPLAHDVLAMTTDQKPSRTRSAW